MPATGAVTDFPTPTAASAPDMPTDETAVLPPGIGTSDAIVEMPTQLRKLALVYLFQWYAIVIYWQYVSVVVAKS